MTKKQGNTSSINAKRQQKSIERAKDIPYTVPAMPKPALGKGLGALISQQNTAMGTMENSSFQQTGEIVRQLPLSSIHPSSLQPRSTFTEEQLEELRDSIREHGIIQPLIVREIDSGYELIAGERRLKASQSLGLKTVPAIIREATDQEVLEMALIENLQRENLSPLEEAAGYLRLKNEFKLKQGEIAMRVGKSRASVANTMRLLDLHPDVQELLISGQLSVGHAKVLLGVKDHDAQKQLAQETAKKSWTVRQTEKAVQRFLNPPEPPAPRKPAPPGYKKICTYLSSQISAPVNISAQGNKGTIEISYSDRSDFIRILELLGLELDPKVFPPASH